MNVKVINGDEDPIIEVTGLSHGPVRLSIIGQQTNLMNCLLLLKCLN